MFWRAEQINFVSLIEYSHVRVLVTLVYQIGVRILAQVTKTLQIDTVISI